MLTTVIDKLFTYHPPKGDQTYRYEKLRDKAKEMALLIDQYTPECPEQTLAIRHIQQAVMFANSAIAINE